MGKTHMIAVDDLNHPSILFLTSSIAMSFLISSIRSSRIMTFSGASETASLIIRVRCVTWDFMVSVSPFQSTS